MQNGRIRPQGSETAGGAASSSSFMTMMSFPRGGGASIGPTESTAGCAVSTDRGVMAVQSHKGLHRHAHGVVLMVAKTNYSATAVG
jgi:hypothetical protein